MCMGEGLQTNEERKQFEKGGHEKYYEGVNLKQTKINNQTPVRNIRWTQFFPCNNGIGELFFELIIFS